MTTNDKNKDEKQEYNIGRKVKKILALSSEKTDKREYLTGEKILPPDKGKVIKRAKFTYSSLGKALRKQT